MAKAKTNYTCTECGGVSNKWSGQCPSCGKWNTLVETVVEVGGNRFSAQPQGLVQGSPVMKLAEIAAADVPRYPTGIDEFDRVLGGGLVSGGVVLIGGDPGIGKSTILLQTLTHLAASQRALYVTGEESLTQVALRARRLEALAAKNLIDEKHELDHFYSALLASGKPGAYGDYLANAQGEDIVPIPGTKRRT